MCAVSLTHRFSSDQQQFSPNYLNTLSREEFMRITKMITIKGDNAEIKLLLLILTGCEETYRNQAQKFICGHLGLKGL